jgi:D-arabinose 1-dehydrogenase-like Zn-dependent alcohol dehydrogenase
VRSLKPGGRIVICGATSGPQPPAELARVYFLQLSVVGSTMGTKSELTDLIDFLRASGLRPHIDRILPLASVRDGMAAMAAGDLVGKIVIEI